MDGGQGYNLRDIVDDCRRRRAPPEFSLALGWFEDACRELAAIHRTGRIHGAICPATILVGEKGVRICPAGPTPPSLVSDWASSGGPPGPSSYMAPERRGDRAGDSRSDLFSLARAFHEVLTLGPPEGPPNPPSWLNSSVPPAFDAIIARMTASRPEDRYPDAEAVLAAVSELRSLPSAARGAVGDPEAGGPSDEAKAPRIGLILAGALVGAAAGAVVAVGLEYGLLVSACVGCGVGAVVGCFVNP